MNDYTTGKMQFNRDLAAAKATVKKLGTAKSLTSTEHGQLIEAISFLLDAALMSDPHFVAFAADRNDKAAVALIVDHWDTASPDRIADALRFINSEALRRVVAGPSDEQVL